MPPRVANDLCLVTQAAGDAGRGFPCERKGRGVVSVEEEKMERGNIHAASRPPW